MGPEKLGRRLSTKPEWWEVVPASPPPPPPTSTPYTGALSCWLAQRRGSESVSRINHQRVLIRWVGL